MSIYTRSAIDAGVFPLTRGFSRGGFAQKGQQQRLAEGSAVSRCRLGYRTRSKPDKTNASGLDRMQPGFLGDSEQAGCRPLQRHPDRPVICLAVNGGPPQRRFAAVGRSWEFLCPAIFVPAQIASAVQAWRILPCRTNTPG